MNDLWKGHIYHKFVCTLVNQHLFFFFYPSIPSFCNLLLIYGQVRFIQTNIKFPLWLHPLKFISINYFFWFTYTIQTSIKSPLSTEIYCQSITTSDLLPSHKYPSSQNPFKIAFKREGLVCLKEFWEFLYWRMHINFMNVIFLNAQV